MGSPFPLQHEKACSFSDPHPPPPRLPTQNHPRGAAGKQFAPADTWSTVCLEGNHSSLFFPPRKMKPLTHLVLAIPCFSCASEPRCRHGERGACWGTESLSGRVSSPGRREQSPSPTTHALSLRQESLGHEAKGHVSPRKEDGTEAHCMLWRGGVQGGGR